MSVLQDHLAVGAIIPGAISAFQEQANILAKSSNYTHAENRGRFFGFLTPPAFMHLN